MRIKLKKIFTTMFLGICFVILAAISSASSTAYAAESKSITINEEYIRPGKRLTTSITGAEESGITYVWYADDKKLANAKSTLSVVHNYVEKMIRVEAYEGETKIGEDSIFCSYLPVVYLNTENNAEIIKEDYVAADFKIQGNDKYNSNTTTLYDGPAKVEGHGNSTWKRFDKKAYKIKLDKKTSLFDMGKNKSWLLIANYIDESCMRNMLSGHLGKKLGTTAMDAVWVDVVLNGKCVGNYQLYEHTKIAKERVDIFDWENAAGDIAEAIAEANSLSGDDEDALKDALEQNLEWMTSGKVSYNGNTYEISQYYELPESTDGGFLIEMDGYFDELSKFRTNRNAPIMLKNPEYLNTNPEVFTSLQNYIQKFEDAIYSKDKHITENGNKVSYVDLCDSKSLVSFWFTSEFLRNEVGGNSTYMHKDIGGPLVFGPIWDFDWSSGSVAPFGSTSAVDWATQSRLWFSAAMQDPYFAVKARELYIDNESVIRETISDGGTLEQWHDYIDESVLNNEKIWSYSRGFEEDYNVLRSWLAKRIKWVDEQFATDTSAMKSLGVPLSDKMELTLNGNTIIKKNSKAYADSYQEDNEYELVVKLKEGSCSKFNYYINGRYIGQVNADNGNSASIMLNTNLLTENLDSKNVISVWSVGANGELIEQQFCTLLLNSGDKTYRNVVLNQPEITIAEKVEKGKYFRFPNPSGDTEKILFKGWKNGERLYTPGTKVRVKADVTYVAEFELCNDGDIYHEWEKSGSAYICKKCEANKADDTSYIDVARCQVTQSSRYGTRYTGKEVAPKIEVRYGDKLLTEGVEYNISIKNNINVGYATYKITGINAAGYGGETELSYRIIPRAVSSAKVELNDSYIEYTGKAIEPGFELSYNGIQLVEGKDYEITGYENNVNIGTASIFVKGKGNFEATKTITFRIVPKATTVKLSLYGYDDVKVTWNKVPQASGYRVYYRKAGASSWITKGYYTGTSVNLPNLADGAKYEVAVRPYKKVDDLSYYAPYKRVSIYALKRVGTPSVSKYSSSKVRVSWTNIYGEGGYQISRSTSKTGTNVVYTYKTTSARSKTISATRGRTYYYKVRAYRTVNGKNIYGPWSYVKSYKLR